MAVVVIFGIAILYWAYQNKKLGISASTETKTIAVDSKEKLEAGQLSNLEINDEGILFIKGLKIQKPTGDISSEKLKLAQENDMVKMYQQTNGPCSGYIPKDWTMKTFEERYGIGTNLTANNEIMNASYMVALVVNPDSGTPGLGPYDASTPEAYIKTMLTANEVTNFQYTSGPHDMNNNYKLAFWSGNFQGDDAKGFAYYTTFPVDSTYYIIALRLGAAKSDIWEKNKAIIFDSVTSMRCKKSLFPVQGGPDIGESDTAKQKGTSGSDIAAAAEKDREAIMGYENTYSPSTGEHYEVSTDLYNKTGPDGPGYYKATGTNSYEKLNMGFGY